MTETNMTLSFIEKQVRMIVINKQLLVTRNKMNEEEVDDAIKRAFEFHANECEGKTELELGMMLHNTFVDLYW